MRYTDDFGCRYRGIPHDYEVLHEDKKAKWERCIICNKKAKFNKGFKGRVDNNEYLKAHVRSFCQKFGVTKRVYNKIYRKGNTTIVI